MSKAVATNAETTTILNVIERAASNPDVDIAKMERLLEMQKDIMMVQARQSYTAAMADMQPELPVIEQRGRGHGKIRYARWEDINETIKPVLAKHGFALSFKTGGGVDHITVAAVLSHREGHTEETEMILPFDASGSKNDIQARGSSTSYGKRYTATALLNITTSDEDDDGRGGGVGPKLSDAQLDELISLADEVGANKEQFCTLMKVGAMAEIKAGDFTRAKDILETKRGKK